MYRKNLLCKQQSYNLTKYSMQAMINQYRAQDSNFFEYKETLQTIKEVYIQCHWWDFMEKTCGQSLQGEMHCLEEFFVSVHSAFCFQSQFDNYIQCSWIVRILKVEIFHSDLSIVLVTIGTSQYGWWIMRT